ncbi:DNA-3-methyladenine glycosylase 2 [Enterococcus camelliae]|uniref:DNA-3-methyladenine glycosylase II n=1 Tax=Enterococcus camelliae TaxID=453959 RepID=A0ABW5TIZ7_9ENTE
MKHTVVLAVPPIFSWTAILGYLSREENEVMYRVTNDTIRRAFEVESDIYLCDITYCSEQGAIEIDLLNQPGWTEESQQFIERFVNDWFDLGTDLSPFYQMASADPLLNELVIKFTELRLVGMPDFYEAITWGILGQQINLGYAYTLKRRFTEKYGRSVQYEGEVYWVYPQPERVASEPSEALLDLRLTVKKAEYLVDISKRIAKGQLSKTALSQFDSTKSAEKAMTKIRGIGPWTAHYVLMRCLRKGDAFPVADVGLLNGIKKLQQLDEKPNRHQMEQFRHQWGTWCSYATFYIWRILY